MYFYTSITFFLSSPSPALPLFLSVSVSLPVPRSLSLPPSLLIFLTWSLQMDEMDPTDELDEIALNALHHIGSKATTGQHWLAYHMW